MADREEMLERLVQRIAPRSRLLRAWPLSGGVSAQMTAFEIEQPDGNTRKLVLRRHGDRDRRRNPGIAADEFRLLQILQAAGMAAPTPCHLERSGELFGAPFLVVEYIEGEIELSPSDLFDHIGQSAAHLARIHSVGADLSFLPRRQARDGAVLPPASSGEPVLLHGDFWPGNVLWKHGRLVAVIDWEDAAIGDPLADLGNARLEILWAFGLDAMRHFTDHYRAITAVDLADLPYWDLDAARRATGKLSTWRLADATERSMRVKLGLFIDRARTTLSAPRRSRIGLS